MRKNMRKLQAFLLTMSFGISTHALCEEISSCGDKYKISIGKASRLLQDNLFEEAKSQLNMAEESRPCFSDIEKQSIAFLWSNYYLKSDSEESIDKVIEHSLEILDLASGNENIDPAFACATILFKLKRPEVFNSHVEYKEMCIRRLTSGAYQGGVVAFGWDCHSAGAPCQPQAEALATHKEICI